VIIGGLMREQVQKTAYKTPVLGDIPGLGKLFRSDQNQRQTVELVILLRPLIVGDASWPGLVSERGKEVQQLNDEAGLGKFEYSIPTPQVQSPSGSVGSPP